MNPLSAAWGVLGIAAVLLFAIVRLAQQSLAAVDGGLDMLQWAVVIINVVFMAWSEGYRGFQRRFSPRVAARALYLYQNKVPIRTKLLAPLFCVGYFDARPRARLGAWLGTLGIIVLVLLVQQLDQPWRGIVDVGVVVGLGWGLVSYGLFVFRAFTDGYCAHSPELS
jgi:hypothetical protein